ncbi:PAS domain-containing protein [Scytonema tolypothrichoides VB-61278]|nr:PAS domain-containing protein [Scytonema tolypothrichoides VB-61278]
MSNQETNPELENLLAYIKRNRGFDFSGYKRTSLSRRIQRRMQVIGIENYTDYLDYLEVHPDEFVELFNTILINVTAFFREGQAWEYIASDIIPGILASKHLSKPIRVWSAGCASGEETYTIAILLAEALGMEEYTARVKVFATDVDVEALNTARQASYNPKDIQSVPANLQEKYFDRVNGRYIVQKELRRGVIFGRHDLVQDAPISRIDLLVCRNTLMYFNTETQAKILDRFHFALNESGFLFLGKAEMLFTRNHSFTPVDLRRRVFTKVPNGNLRDMLLNMGHSSGHQPVSEMVDQIRIHEAAFEIDPVAQLVVDLNSIVLLANAEARNLFNLHPRDLGRPLQDLELSYRPVELRSRIDHVRTNRRPIILKDIEWPGTDRDMKYIDVQIMPLMDDNTDELLGVKIIFTDVTRFKNLQQELVHANQELETAYEELQSTNEELETTNEELQSTVEELETTNEELQSTNEELETMNEELQSTNEELQTINEELRQRSDELNRVNGFLESILTSLRVGVVVLSPDLHILIWNRKAEDLWGLRFDEVFSKHFMTLDIGLPLEPLRQPMRTILIGDSEHYEVLLDARNRRGKAIQCQVICNPLLGSGSDIQGVIVLMEEREQVE